MTPATSPLRLGAPGTTSTLGVNRGWPATCSIDQSDHLSIDQRSATAPACGRQHRRLPTEHEDVGIHRRGRRHRRRPSDRSASASEPTTQRACGHTEPLASPTRRNLKYFVIMFSRRRHRRRLSNRPFDPTIDRSPRPSASTKRLIDRSIDSNLSAVSIAMLRILELHVMPRTRRIPSNNKNVFECLCRITSDDSNIDHHRTF